MFDLTGKTAIVTGSSRGIGEAIAHQLAAQGANVVITSRNQDSCDKVAADIEAKGGNVLAVASNISAPDSLNELVDAARAKFGKIDILVANAASNPYYGSLLDIDQGAFDKIMQNNILSSIRLAKLVSDDMEQAGEGSIVIVSSIGGMTGSGIIGAYNISKAGDFQLARELAVELGPKNIRVNCVAPGLIKTDFARALWENDKMRTAFESHAPLRRIGEPDDIAGAVAFLASPAARYVTGTTIVADGGVTIAGAG